MLERIHLPLARIFTRVILAGAIMFPVIHAGQAAADTRVRVKVVTPNVRVEVVKGQRHARTYAHESYRWYPEHRYYSPEYVVVRIHGKMYRVVPERSYWEGNPDYRRHYVRYHPYDRGWCDSHDRVSRREYDRGGCASQGRDRGREYSRGEEEYDD